MIFVDESDSLSHYGVLGMKWGVRKDGMPQGYKGNGSAKAKRRRAAIEGGLIGYGIERNKQKKNGDFKSKNKQSSPKEAANKAKEFLSKPETKAALAIAAGIGVGVGALIIANRIKSNKNTMDEFYNYMDGRAAANTLNFDRNSTSRLTQIMPDGTERITTHIYDDKGNLTELISERSANTQIDDLMKAMESDDFVLKL